MPVAQDLPHDLVVEPDGDVLITGMFTHRLYRLKPESGAMTEIPIPVERQPARDRPRRRGAHVAGPGAAQAARHGGGGHRLAERDVGMYPHSLAVAPDGKVWFNGHFTREPELIGSWIRRAKGRDLPDPGTSHYGEGSRRPHSVRDPCRARRSHLAGRAPGQPAGVRPATDRFQIYTMPTPHSGPRRFDVDAKGMLWIPAYSANLLVRLDPATSEFKEIPLPVKDAVPYVTRVDPRDGAIWIGTAAADVLFRYEPRSGIRDLSAAESRRPGATPGRGSQDRSGVAGVRGVARDTRPHRAAGAGPKPIAQGPGSLCLPSFCRSTAPAAG